MVGLESYLALSLLLFFIGACGVLGRRNIFAMIIGIELMLNAVNLTFVAYGRYMGTVDSQVFALFIMAVAAAEICVGLALVICMFRLKKTTTIDEFALLKE